MIQQIFTIYDSAAEAHQAPFFQPTKGLAIRMFTDGVNDPKSFISQHPLDFTLFELGKFHDGSGSFELYPAPLPILNGGEVVESATLEDVRHPRINKEMEQVNGAASE